MTLLHASYNTQSGHVKHPKPWDANQVAYAAILDYKYAVEVQFTESITQGRFIVANLNTQAILCDALVDFTTKNIKHNGASEKEVKHWQRKAIEIVDAQGL